MPAFSQIPEHFPKQAETLIQTEGISLTGIILQLVE